MPTVTMPVFADFDELKKSHKYPIYSTDICPIINEATSKVRKCPKNNKWDKEPRWDDKDTAYQYIFEKNDKLICIDFDHVKDESIVTEFFGCSLVDIPGVVEKTPNGYHVWLKVPDAYTEAIKTKRQIKYNDIMIDILRSGFVWVAGSRYKHPKTGEELQYAEIKGWDTEIMEIPQDIINKVLQWYENKPKPKAENAPVVAVDIEEKESKKGTREDVAIASTCCEMLWTKADEYKESKTWLQLIYAVHSVAPDAEGLELVKSVTTKMTGYDTPEAIAETTRAFNNAKGDSGVTIGTLIKWSGLDVSAMRELMRVKIHNFIPVPGSADDADWTKYDPFIKLVNCFYNRTDGHANGFNMLVSAMYYFWDIGYEADEVRKCWDLMKNKKLRRIKLKMSDVIQTKNSDESDVEDDDIEKRGEDAEDSDTEIKTIECCGFDHNDLYTVTEFRAEYNCGSKCPKIKSSREINKLLRDISRVVAYVDEHGGSWITKKIVPVPAKDAIGPKHRLDYELAPKAPSIDVIVWCTDKDDGGRFKNLELSAVYKKYRRYLPYYTKITFDPEHTLPGNFNLWRGFTVEPATGTIDEHETHIKLWLAHTMEVIANNNETACERLICWIASMIQKPWKKTEKFSVFLEAKFGCGRTTWSSPLHALFGTHALRADSMDDVIPPSGGFNGISSGKVFIEIEEMGIKGKVDLRAEEGRIRKTITAMTRKVNEKFEKPREEINCVNIIGCCNPTDTGAPLGVREGERRIDIYRVSTQRIINDQYANQNAENKQYFTDLWKEMTAPEFLPHFLAYFQKVRLPYDIVTAPVLESEERDRIKDSQKNNIRQFIQEFAIGLLMRRLDIEERGEKIWQPPKEKSKIKIIARGSYTDETLAKRFDSSGWLPSLDHLEDEKKQFDNMAVHLLIDSDDLAGHYFTWCRDTHISQKDIKTTGKFKEAIRVILGERERHCGEFNKKWYNNFYTFTMDEIIKKL